MDAKVVQTIKKFVLLDTGGELEDLKVEYPSSRAFQDNLKAISAVALDAVVEAVTCPEESSLLAQPPTRSPFYHGKEELQEKVRQVRVEYQAVARESVRRLHFRLFEKPLSAAKAQKLAAEVNVGFEFDYLPPSRLTMSSYSFLCIFALRVCVFFNKVEKFELFKHSACFRLLSLYMLLLLLLSLYNIVVLCFLPSTSGRKTQRTASCPKNRL
jgi:hypothetical protein